jgi:hypothetical protein
VLVKVAHDGADVESGILRLDRQSGAGDGRETDVEGDEAAKCPGGA